VRSSACAGSAAVRVERFALTTALVLLSLCSAPSASHAFVLGFTDSVYNSPDQSLRSAWFDRTAAAGAEVVDIGLVWSSIAPASRSAGFDATSPGAPGYNWETADGAVREATARGLTVLAQIMRAPRWAEGKRRSADAPEGTFRPSPAALGAFARAAALRYSGTFTPVGAGAPLPRVRLWQVWGEPNLSVNLYPQWVRKRGRFRMDAPDHYRRMLNAAYRGIHAAQQDARVITAGTAPYGDYHRGAPRIPPLQFWREAMCLTGTRCTMSFDALAHDPYSVGSPRRRALNADDISVVDMHKLNRLLRAAARRRSLAPRGTKQLWVTEVSWDSSPPDPRGVPARRHARWLAEAFYLFWKVGVDGVLWFQIRDAAPSPSYGGSYQSGIYLRDGRPKPAQQAFRFPFVVDRAARRIWGRAPQSGVVTIERKSGSTWRAVVTARTSTSRVFFIRRSVVRGTVLRARVGGDVSLSWTAR
jgi:hypothetical protein